MPYVANLPVDTSQGEGRVSVGAVRASLDFAAPTGLEGFSIITPLEISVAVSGQQQILRNWLRLADDVKKRAWETTWFAAERVFAESQELVPVNKDPDAPSRGNLQSSGYIEPDPHSDLGDGPTKVLIGYDMGKADYAWDQHENTSYTHLPGRQDHYLSEPAARASVDYPDDMKVELTDAVRQSTSMMPRLVKRPR